MALSTSGVGHDLAAYHLALQGFVTVISWAFLVALPPPFMDPAYRMMPQLGGAAVHHSADRVLQSADVCLWRECAQPIFAAQLIHSFDEPGGWRAHGGCRPVAGVWLAACRT